MPSEYLTCGFRKILCNAVPPLKAIWSFNRGSENSCTKALSITRSCSIWPSLGQGACSFHSVMYLLVSFKYLVQHLVASSICHLICLFCFYEKETMEQYWFYSYLSFLPRHLIIFVLLIVPAYSQVAEW